MKSRKLKSGFNVLNPDGEFVSTTNFDSINQAKKFVNEWLKKFKEKGIYESTKHGKIPLKKIIYHLTIIEFRYFSRPFSKPDPDKKNVFEIVDPNGTPINKNKNYNSVKDAVFSAFDWIKENKKNGNSYYNFDNGTQIPFEDVIYSCHIIVVSEYAQKLATDSFEYISWIKTIYNSDGSYEIKDVEKYKESYIESLNQITYYENDNKTN